ncbi:MAG: TfoX/Sxy family protein [Cyanobacteria bacterium P01_G01_bin.38]
MIPLQQLKNLGAVSIRWLNAVNIYTSDDLKTLGPIEAYGRVRLAGYPATLNLLYALQGALTATPWSQIESPRRKP